MTPEFERLIEQAAAELNSEEAFNAAVATLACAFDPPPERVAQILREELGDLP